jgi:hypothetical protein
MIQSTSSWPFERPEQLAEALREQGAGPEEIADLLPALQRLSEIEAPQPSPADTQRLFAQLMPALPGFSPVRQAIREHRQQHASRLSGLLATARTQVSLFGPSFWLVSALVTLVGAMVSIALPGQELTLRASGPFLAFLGTIIAFRGMGMGVVECELVCPPSPMQLAMARLVIVLGYDLSLGFALGLALWASGSDQVLALTLAWIMPLLLVAGLALLLSLRLPVQIAASLAYGSWLAVLALDAISMPQVLPLTSLSDAVLGSLGLVLLAIALLRFRLNVYRVLPRY